MTLEELYSRICDKAAERAYVERRAEKVSEIVDYLDGRLREGVDVKITAEDLMAAAEEMGRIRGNIVSGEVAGRYTATGNPLPFEL